MIVKQAGYVIHLIQMPDTSPTARHTVTTKHSLHGSYSMTYAKEGKKTGWDLRIKPHQRRKT